MSGPPAPPAATLGQRARAVWNDHWAGPDPYPAGESQEETFERVWGDIAQAVLNGAFPGLKRELTEARQERDVYQRATRLALAERDDARNEADRLRPLEAEAQRAHGEVTRLCAERDEARQLAAMREEALIGRDDELDRLRAERDKLTAELTQARQAHDTWAAQLTAERDKALADLAGIQHGAGAWVRETVARENAGIEAQRNEARAEAASRRAEREKLSGACQLLARTLSMYVRSLYATWIDAAQHRNLKAVIEALSESLDGFDGPEWNGTETGTEWLERTRGVDVVSEPLSEGDGDAAGTASVLADPETMAAIAEGEAELRGEARDDA